jgi:DNA-directed RNA polymerase subunit L
MFGKRFTSIQFRLISKTFTDRKSFKPSFSINFRMEIKILKDEKNELEVSIDNQTVAELIRVYLNVDDSVKFAAWRKEHYSKPLILKVVTDGKTAKKALNDAIAKARKDLEKYSDEFKKTK